MRAFHGTERPDFTPDYITELKRVIVDSEEKRSAIRIGKSTHTLEPAANLLPPKLSLEIIGRAFGNEYVVFYSHKSSVSIVNAPRSLSAGSLYTGRNYLRCGQIFAMSMVKIFCGNNHPL